MRSPSIPHPEFEFPTLMVPRGDGSFVIKPGKPIAKESEISVAEAAKILCMSIWTVHRYVDRGLLTAKQVMPRSKYRLIRAQVEKLANNIKE